MTGCGFRTATGLGGSVCIPLLIVEDAVTACGHACNRFSPLTVRGQGIEVDEPDVSCVGAVAVPQAPIVSEALAAVAPRVVGVTVAVLPSAVQDLARFFLSLAGSSSQGAVLRAAGASVPASGVRVQLCPRLWVEEQSLLVLRRRLLRWRLDLLPHPLLCLVRPADSSVRKRSPVRVDAAVTRPVVGPAARVRDVLGNPPLPLFALLATGRLPIGLLLVLLKKIEPSSGLVAGGTSGDFRPAPAGDRSPRPGPLGLRRPSSAVADQTRSGLGGHLSPHPLGEADNDHSSALDSLDFDRDDSFRSVLALIRNFHRMEEPAGVPSACCKTSLASIHGLMLETSLAFHLPTSPLLRSLLDDINLALSKFLEDQTVHGFLPMPGRRHRRYYHTSSSSFPGPYSVPPGVTSITLEKASEVKKRSVSLSASQVLSLETMLSRVCEVASWLDWWLSTCGGFREHLPVEVCANFELMILSGSRALEFLASQGVTALGNLVLSRRDALLVDVRSTVPAEEVARLRYFALPETLSLFPSPLLDSALSKMRAAANDTLVQRTLHPPRILRKPAAGGSSSTGSAQADSSDASCPAQKQSSASSPSEQEEEEPQG